MKVYLAHPVTDYGGSTRQLASIAAIEARGWTVENPDHGHHQVGYKDRGMDYFFEVIASCDSLAFLRFPNGSIGAGVAREIDHARSLDLPVFEIVDDALVEINSQLYPILSVAETREMLKSLRPRVVCWFSCGDASAVATRLAIKKYEKTHEIVIARIIIPNEHHDNERFARDCAAWFGIPIIELRSTEYVDAWDVWERKRYIAGVKGAPCTTHLKKIIRKNFQRVDDIHVMGYSIEEIKRATRFCENNFELSVCTPLIDAQLNKQDCHAVVRAAGIELPAMYLLGFDNNNCIGCPKGGAGYWNMIRLHFPDVFDRMAKLSRELGCRLVKQKGTRVFLDELDPSTGRQKDEVTIDCSAFCGAVIDDMK